MGPFLPITKLCLSLLNRIGARRTPCISFAPYVSTRGQMAVNFKRRPSGMTQSGKALSAPFSNRSLLATWEARSLFPWESLRVLFRTSQYPFRVFGPLRSALYQIRLDQQPFPS
ncbi:hypothetical protein AVEN_77368-1 [Araneus ventricosus]|uniref:Uncharacterized protein n=1 Tax=Araneus ventricosus TaxID=182803 RepID=A0A4Y2C810_ARAVE|nr:hypothetical protein AVEN_77368-1 [Araneus ventricosus]